MFLVLMFFYYYSLWIKPSPILQHFLVEHHVKCTIKWVMNWIYYSTGLGAREMEDSLLLNEDWMSKMWSHCMKAVGDWFSSCEENIILHTLQSIRFWDCIFCFFIKLFLHPLHKLFFLCIFLQRSSRLNFSMNAKSPLCVPESQILFLSTTVENTKLACYHRNILKNQLSDLGWISSIIL